MSKKPSAHLKKISDRLGLDIKEGDIIENYDPNGDPVIIIKRQGYRKIAYRQPDYIKHTVYPIYPGTTIESDKDDVRVSISGDMSNITGALGVLYKSMPEDGNTYITHYVSMFDYEHKLEEPLGVWWRRMPQNMLSKTCEAALIRLAYPDLFSDTYLEEEDPMRETTSRKEMLAFIRTNMRRIGDVLPEDSDLGSLSNEELRDLYRKAKEALDESNTKTTKH